MGFYLLTSIGESFYITSESLRDRLINNNPSISTQRSESDSLLSLDYFRRNEQKSELDIFLEKLKFSDLVIGPKEVQYLFERFAEFDDTNIELLSSLFVFERTHFLTIIYLFNKNLIGIEEVSDLVRADVRNRTELLLSYMSRENITINIMEPFYAEVQKYFRRSDQYKIYSTTIFDSIISKTRPLHNYASYSLIVGFKRIFNLTRGAAAFDHVQWKDPLEWWQRLLVFSVIGVVTLGIVALVAVVPIVAVLVSLGITTLITTLSDIISLPYQRMFSLSFHDSFFNKSYPLIILNNFFIARNKPKQIAENSLQDYYVRDSVAQVFSQNDVGRGTAKPPMIPLYAYMYWIYEDFNNITKNGIDLVDFNQNINNPFRASLINHKDKIYNIDNYLPLNSSLPKYPFLNNVIKTLFPLQTSFATNQTAQPVLSSEILDILVAKYNTSTKRIESNSAAVNRLRFILTDLFNSDYVIDDNLVVNSLGVSNKVYFILESVRKAMTTHNITNLNVASRDALDMNSVKEFVSNFKSRIVGDILVQTTNSPSDAFFKIIMKDIIENYLDYLVDPSKSSFNVLKVTEETFKVYRLLKFLRLYFANTSLVVNLLNNNAEYKFYLGTADAEVSNSISSAASSLINASNDSGSAPSSGGSPASTRTFAQLE